jgi:transposase-like protein
MRYYTEGDLAQRWDVSPKTLQKWRWQRHGPKFLKIGASVR